jgi:hypothetical protein
MEFFQYDNFAYIPQYLQIYASGILGLLLQEGELLSYSKHLSCGEVTKLQQALDDLRLALQDGRLDAYPILPTALVGKPVKTYWAGC